MKTVLTGLALVLLAVLAVLLVLASGFSRDIARTEARLAAHPPGPLRSDLPPAVQLFAERGMAGGAPASAARFTQAAEMRLKPGAPWTAMPARQITALPVSGFAWVAEMRFGPLPAVRVIDSYEAGAGRLEVRALGAIPIGRETGPDAALGEALRYLAELPWTPDAIVLNPEIAWAETPDGVTARIDTAGGPAAVLFGFDEAGDIVSMRSDGRPARLPDGTPARLVWRGHLSDYAEIGGRRIPLRAEVGYDYPDGYESYWRGRITGYSVAASAAN